MTVEALFFGALGVLREFQGLGLLCAREPLRPALWVFGGEQRIGGG